MEHPFGPLPEKPDWTAVAAEAVDVKPGETAAVEFRAAPGRKVTGKVIDAERNVPLACVSIGCYGAARPKQRCLLHDGQNGGQGSVHFACPAG